MFHRHAIHHRRTDFLGVLVFVVGLAFLLTLAFQARAAYVYDRCETAGDIGQRQAAMLDSTPSNDGGYARCQTGSTSASWASAIWGASTR